MIHAYSENGWDPLKIVLLGDFIPPDLLKETLNFSKFDAIKPWLMKIAYETEEDLNNIQHILEQQGVKVLRPFAFEKLQTKYQQQVENWINQTPTPKFTKLPIPISPRNEIIVYKDVVIGLTEMLTLLEDIIDNDITSFNETQYRNMHIPCIFRCNDTLIIGDEITDEEFEVLKTVFPKDTKYIKTDIAGHVDAAMATLREGLVVYSLRVSEKDLNRTFPNWTHLYCDKFGWNVKSDKDAITWSEAIRSLTDGNWDIAGYDGDNPEEIVETINANFSNWTGKAYETHFDVNMLTINPNLSLTVGTDSDLKKKIEQEGHELITVPLRHRWFFDQGLHCITCDILREK